MSTWLLAIARHKAISALRGRRAHEEIDECLAVEDSSDSPYITAEIRDRDAGLRECVSKLSPNHREVLDLVYYQEKPIETVASMGTQNRGPLSVFSRRSSCPDRPALRHSWLPYSEQQR